MDDRASIGPRLDPQRRDEWTGINFLLSEMRELRSRGLVLDEAYRTIVEEYSTRRDVVERIGRYLEAIAKARDLAVISPREAYSWSCKAREIATDRPEGWVVGVDLLRRMGRTEEADRLAEEASTRFPDLARPKTAPRAVRFLDDLPARPARPESTPAPMVPKISWSSVAGEFLEEHWQKLISGLAVLLIVVSSTVGASLVLGPLLWSPIGKVVLALVFTGLCAGFGFGLARWGAERAGRLMLATSLILVPINFMLLGELRLLAGASVGEGVLVAIDAALLLAMARGVVVSLGFASAGTFTAAFFALGAFNAGASRGMPFEAGFSVFLAPCVVFLGAVAWLNRRVKTTEEPARADIAHLEFGLLAFAFVLGVLRTGGAVLQLGPTLYAIPAMLTAIAGVSTARAIAPIEKDRRVIVLFQQGGLALSALAFALALARPTGPSALYSGNLLAVALLGLALYATSLRATRLPAYLYCGFGALFVAYFGTYYFAHDLVRSIEEVARKAMGYDRPLPLPFKAINGLAFNVGLAWLSRFFARRWSDERLAWHCHAIGLPLSVAACVLGAFEPKAAVICMGGYAVLYSLATPIFAEPRLIYLACSATAGAAFFGASLAGGAGLGLRSLLASGLGLIFWAIRATPPLRRAGEAYRIPLIRSARVMAAGAMAAATLGAIGAGAIPPLATLAFLLTAILALLNGRESPRVSIYFLAIAALLGSWLGGFHQLAGEPTTAMANGLAIAGFAVALTLAGEALRHWLGRSEASGAYLDAVGWSVPLLVLGSWGLAIWAGVDSVTVARTFLVGSSALLWLTRFRRESVLVYLGLAGLTAWAASLCGLVVPGLGTGRLESWLALTVAGVSLAYWAVGEWVRRRDDDPFYSGPCFLTAGALAVGAALLALDARWLSVDSYRVGVAAMFAGSASLGLIAWSRRWPSAVALSTGQVVAASYLTILSQEPSSPDSAWILALVAALGAIASRGAGMLIRGVSREPNSPMARPLDFWALALLIGALPLGLESPATLLAVAAGSVLMVGCFPSNRWLYGTALALMAAIYRGWLWRSTGDGAIPFVLLGAYASWGVAVALQRYGPALLGRLGLSDLGLHVPPVRVSVGLGLLAAVIRVGMVAKSGDGWADLPWLPWVLALLCLLMLRFEPQRGWVHLAVGLTGFGFAATLSPWVEPGRWWLSASMALACSWWLSGRLAVRFESALRRRLGIAEGEDSIVFEGWSLAASGLTGVALVAVVAFATFAPDAGVPGDWPDVLLSLGLAGFYVGLEGRRFGRDVVLMGLEAIGLLLAWWLAAPDSPLPGRVGLDRDAYLPLSTAAAACVAVWLGRWAETRARGGVFDPSGGTESPGPSRLVEWTSCAGFALGIVSVYLAVGTGGWTVLGTLVLATSALGFLALAWKRVESAVEGGVTWCLAWAVGLYLATPGLGWMGSIERTRAIAIGFASALFGLWWAAGWERRRGEGKGGEAVGSRRVASALEWVAIAATVPATFFALIDGDAGTWPSLAVLFALAAFFAMVAWRRKAEWPAYLAQGLLLGCYFRARPLLAPSGVADAVILSLLAYLDLGVSELMGRLRLSPFARPTIRFAMALPLVPILRGAWLGRWDEADLFVLLATAAFYALASFRLRSKTPAYAAALAFNAFLWLAWYRMGWRMAESPQFYLIPVGFSAILFGEVNRRELGRAVVNGARNLGLVVIYASLVAPIWQGQSFGAWLALLLLSLVGIFAGIGLRVQSFLWLGLACFVLDVTYQLARMGVDHVLARWAVMLTLGVALMLFVALNEKKRIVATLKAYYDEARGWE